MEARDEVSPPSDDFSSLAEGSAALSEVSTFNQTQNNPEFLGKV